MITNRLNNSLINSHSASAFDRLVHNWSGTYVYCHTELVLSVVHVIHTNNSSQSEYSNSDFDPTLQKQSSRASRLAVWKYPGLGHGTVAAWSYLLRLTMEHLMLQGSLMVRLCILWPINILSCCFLPRRIECRRGLAMTILSVRPSVCLSVCLSIERVTCDKTEEKCVQIFIPYERLFSLVF